MKKDVKDQIKIFEKENKKSFENYQKRGEVLDFVSQAKFNILGFEELKNGFSVYTNDFSVVDQYKIVTLGYNEDSINHGPYDKDELTSKSYSKIFEFYSSKSFGDIELGINLRDNWMKDNKFNVLFEYRWNQNGGGLYLPNPLEKMVGFYQEKGMQEELLKEVSEVVKIASELVRV